MLAGSILILRITAAAVFLVPLAFGLGVADDPYEHVRLGCRAMDAGKMHEAYEHFCGALVHDPGSTEVLELLLQTIGEDDSARILWSHAWYAAAADLEGRAKPGREAGALLVRDDRHLSKVAVARADAVKELVSFAGDREKGGYKECGDVLVAVWARRLARELASASPSLEKSYGRGLAPMPDLPSGFHMPVIKALEQAMKRSFSSQHVREALDAAICLHGLGVQAAFKDLKGERPGSMGGVRRMGAEGMARGRSQLRSRIGEPWSVEALESLTEAESEGFTREHASFSNPGVAVSLTEKYKVETTCGYETLLGVALTVEDHHDRLVNWFEQDPFEGRQGLVRIVPEAHGLEAEGAPYWWVGGFQGGDTTTLRLSCGTVEGLGHGLTHELTHRFDGAIYPGMPSWLLEGRAVWTGGAYGSSRDERFVPNHASFQTIYNAWIKGYGNERKLEELIEGGIEDYRDNYVAGYALYLYLSSWEQDGEKPYAERLYQFMKGCGSGRKNPKSWFLRNFADGKEGRPDGLKAFAEAFQAFMSGFYWKHRKPWTGRYTTSVPKGRDDPYVYDEPTWTWSRVRAEPYFGEEQARKAGELLLEMGRKEEAAHALVWAASVDRPSFEVSRCLARVFKELHAADASWAADHMASFPFLEHSAGAAPYAGSLNRTMAFMKALEGAASEYRENGFLQAAASFVAERNRLAAWLGLLPAEPPDLSTAKQGEFEHPIDSTPRHLGSIGWEEEELTSYEEFRHPNLWFTTDGNDLHVGRKRPRKGTGIMDRAAHQRHAFARSNLWLFPGAYRIKTRIKFTTSYVAGAVVFGYARRHQNLRFQFSAGDLMYAIGETEDEPSFDSVNWHLHGLRCRDGALPGSVGRGGFAFERASPSFDLELFVEGATVQAFINHTLVGTYHTVDGAPIEGYVGFASSYGAFCAQFPRVERLDRSMLAGLPGSLPMGLDLALSGSKPFKELINLPVRGLPVSSRGTVLAWIPMPWIPDGESLDLGHVMSQARRAAEKISSLMKSARSPQPFVLVIPAAVGEERIAALRDELENGELDIKPELVTHRFQASVGTTDPVTPDDNRRWFFFLDSVNVVRVALPLVGVLHERRIEGNLLHWLTVFRDHGWTERAR